MASTCDTVSHRQLITRTRSIDTVAAADGLTREKERKLVLAQVRHLEVRLVVCASNVSYACNWHAGEL